MRRLGWEARHVPRTQDCIAGTDRGGAGRTASPAAPARRGPSLGPTHPGRAGLRGAWRDQPRGGRRSGREPPDGGDLARALRRAPLGGAGGRAALRGAADHRRRGGRAPGRPDAGGGTAERHALEHARDGAPRRHEPDRGEPHLARLRPAAAPGGDLQALHRSGIRREGARHCRALPGPAGARPGAVRGREAANPGRAGHGAGIPSAAGPSRTAHSRLPPPRHARPLRRPRREGRHGDPRLRAASPQHRVPCLPRPRRAGRAAGC